jgi:hypothetical protein
MCAALCREQQQYMGMRESWQQMAKDKHGRVNKYKLCHAVWSGKYGSSIKFASSVVTV